MQGRNNDESWIGKKFGKITVIGFERKQGRERGWNWRVRCDCGKEKIVSPSDVKNGKTRSCGCFHDDLCRQRATKFKHNVYEYRRLYGIYNGIKKRCYKETYPRYKDYGGRGIVMCDEWLNPENGFDKFVEWALSHGYKDDLTIERTSVDGDYCPENCCWITRKAQAGNKRETRWVDYKGEHIQLIALCERLGVSYDTVHDRIYKRGWTVDKAIEEPSQREDSLRRKCKEAGVNYGTVFSRIKKFGWSEEEALSTLTTGRGANISTYGKSFPPKICKVCGEEFMPKMSRQIYCGENCRVTSKKLSFKKKQTG